MLEPKTVITRGAAAASNMLAEISEHECAATKRGIRILMHLIQLCEIGDAPSLQCIPIDGKVLEW